MNFTYTFMMIFISILYLGVAIAATTDKIKQNQSKSELVILHGSNQFNRVLDYKYKKGLQYFIEKFKIMANITETHVLYHKNEKKEIDKLLEPEFYEPDWFQKLNQEQIDLKNDIKNLLKSYDYKHYKTGVIFGLQDEFNITEAQACQFYEFYSMKHIQRHESFSGIDLHDDTKNLILFIDAHATKDFEVLMSQGSETEGSDTPISKYLTAKDIAKFLTSTFNKNKELESTTIIIRTCHSYSIGKQLAHEIDQTATPSLKTRISILVTTTESNKVCSSAGFSQLASAFPPHQLYSFLDKSVLWWNYNAINELPFAESEDFTKIDTWKFSRLIKSNYVTSGAAIFDGEAFGLYNMKSEHDKYSSDLDPLVFDYTPTKLHLRTVLLQFEKSTDNIPVYEKIFSLIEYCKFRMYAVNGVNENSQSPILYIVANPNTLNVKSTEFYEKKVHMNQSTAHTEYDKQIDDLNQYYQKFKYNEDFYLYVYLDITYEFTSSYELQKTFSHGVEVYCFDDDEKEYRLAETQEVDETPQELIIKWFDYENKLTMKKFNDCYNKDDVVKWESEVKYKNPMQGSYCYNENNEYKWMRIETNDTQTTWKFKNKEEEYVKINSSHCISSEIFDEWLSG